MSERKLHRNFGVYGICVQENKLLVHFFMGSDCYTKPLAVRKR